MRRLLLIVAGLILLAAGAWAFNGPSTMLVRNGAWYDSSFSHAGLGGM